MSVAGRQESYHTVRSLDISNFSLEERKALYNTEGDTAFFLESSKGTTRRAFSAWFECPVTTKFYPVTEGVRIDGVLYSREAAIDIFEDRRRERS